MPVFRGISFEWNALHPCVVCGEKDPSTLEKSSGVCDRCESGHSIEFKGVYGRDASNDGPE